MIIFFYHTLKKKLFRFPLLFKRRNRNIFLIVRIFALLIRSKTNTVKHCPSWDSNPVHSHRAPMFYQLSCFVPHEDTPCAAYTNSPTYKSQGYQAGCRPTSSVRRESVRYDNDPQYKFHEFKKFNILGVFHKCKIIFMYHFTGINFVSCLLQYYGS